MVTDNEARQLVGLLVAGTPGWTDEAVDLYVAEVACLDRPDLAFTAVRQVIRTYSRPGRPPLAVILEAYRRKVDRSPAPQVPALRGSVTSPERGLLLAWRAYSEACRLEGREPDRKRFGTFAHNLPSSS